MKNCQNCGTPIPKEFQTEKSPLCDYCSRECYELFMREPKGAKPLEAGEEKQEELKKEAKTKPKTGRNLKSESDIWIGQERRKRAMDTMVNLAKECLPMEYDEFICSASYRTGLSLRKITDEYLKILLKLGFIVRDGNMLRLPEKEN